MHILFLMMMDCALSWFHKTPFTAQMLHTVHGTQGSYLHNVQRLHIPKTFYTSHVCTVCTQQTIAQRAWLSGAHSCTASRARKLFSHNSFDLDTKNVDYTDEFTIFKEEEVKLSRR